VVYSTCSLNPLENEAVVASVIHDVGGLDAMEIVPLPEWLVNKCGILNGLESWYVPHPKFGKKDDVKDMYVRFEDVPVEHQGGSISAEKNDAGKNKKKKKGGGQINPSMFPPPKDTEIRKQLGHCGRLIPNAKLDSGGFFVACIRRLQVGELRAKWDSQKEASKITEVARDGKDTVPATTNTTARNNGEDELAKETEDAAKLSPGNNNPTTKDDLQCLREGDWICTSCKKINFGRRGSSRCFDCKARKPQSAKNDDKEDKVQRPLLVPPNESILESFFNFFGIVVANKKEGPEEELSIPCSFPLQNTRFICRSTKAKEHTIVVVSEALSKLAISESWSPVRELGITLAAIPIIEPSSDGDSLANNPQFRLLDEGIPLLSLYATRRHLRLPPASFRNALAQSVRRLLLDSSSSPAEMERVKATLRRAFVEVNSLCEKKMWYDSLDDSMMSSTWELCKASPGYFIVSCECSIPDSDEGSMGRFAFCGCIDAQGNVAVKTSLRVVAAMLMILHKYLGLVTNSNNDDAPLTKRRKIRLS